MNTNAIDSMFNTNRTSSNPSSRTAQSEQRDLFMSLLVAQLKNQDPLQPQDGTEFVAQLTQFNSLDQLTGIRETLDQLVSAIQGGNSTSKS